MFRIEKYMGKISVTIEKGDELFGAWAESIKGIYGEGRTVKETKENLLASIRLYKELNMELPVELRGDVEVEWHFDVPSFLQYYDGIFTKAALERITGINQKQLGHYASGRKRPRRNQVEKMEKAMHGFIDELNQVHLV